ncbi:dihydrolipoyl dehydrogenase family protein [Burkholderia sp. WSM2232]|uniref:dihydrolipoyl dehydrogenase family protein n=1 Tax=Burkholderia sp. WSM2232 TaxID=944436 RepID=UPI00047F5856|nr:mercuric reductase [Burkholderia sp. WSM2232]
MLARDQFDLIVLGGGKAGKTLAMDQAKAGKRVAMIERGMIGGSCINVACIPTKALVKSAKVAATARHAAAYGIETGSALTDMKAVGDRVRAVVDGMIEINWKGFNASGMEVIVGEGRFVDPTTVEISLADGGMRRISGEHIFVNTGTRAAVPPVPGLREAEPLTHVEALQLAQTPEHLIVVGGGYIGVEMAQAFARLGSRVTILQRESQLAPREDEDIASAVADVLRADGVEIVLETQIERIEGRSGDAVTVHAAVRGEPTVLSGTHLLVATGRIPNTDGIGLNNAGVEVDQRGIIKVDEHLRTSAMHIWALGEVAGTPMFTHASLDDYRVCKSALSGGNRTTRDRLIPYAMFIDPELGRVGISEKEAAQQNIAIRVAKLPMAAVPRARTNTETTGFMKVIVDAGSDRILGFCMLGTNAGEVIAAIQVAMLAGAPYTMLRDAIWAHPTITEGLNMLLALVPAE